MPLCKNSDLAAFRPNWNLCEHHQHLHQYEAQNHQRLHQFEAQTEQWSVWLQQVTCRVTEIIILISSPPLLTGAHCTPGWSLSTITSARYWHFPFPVPTQMSGNRNWICLLYFWSREPRRLLWLWKCGDCCEYHQGSGRYYFLLLYIVVVTRGRFSKLDLQQLGRHNPLTFYGYFQRKFPCESLN